MSGLSNEDLRFGDFLLEADQRRLSRAGETIELGARYLDALLLLARHPGELVGKDRFMAEVWNGIPVTDEALTQCIRTLRRALGDEAARPRFIETVPRHGYRFVVPVMPVASAEGPGRQSMVAGTARPGPGVLLMTGAGLAGGAAAGLLGGIGYGLLAASTPPPGFGAISLLLAVTSLCLLIGLIGGAGTGLGMGVARRWFGSGAAPSVWGGLIGGGLTGGLVRLIGIDAFALVTGRAPLEVTGLFEGVIIGALAGLACWWALVTAWPRRGIAGAAAGLGAFAGAGISLTDGRLVAGSIAALARFEPDAPLAQVVARLPEWAIFLGHMIEGAVFSAALALACAAVRERSGA